MDYDDFRTYLVEKQEKPVGRHGVQHFHSHNKMVDALQPGAGGAARRQTRGQEGREQTHGRQGQVGRDMFGHERNSDSWTRLEKEERGKCAREKEIQCWIHGIA